MVELDQVSFGYGRDRLFTDTTLKLAPGNIYGLLGLNGAGKSTLLQLMSGLLFVGKGRITAGGYNPAERTPGYLSQLFLLPENLNVPRVTGHEFISVRAPFYPKFDHKQMSRCLDAFDISTAPKLTELSYGQQKKFLLSFGLACNTALLMLDEPTNGLDIPSKSTFRKLVAESLNEEQLFIVSTHQVHDVEALIDSVVMLHRGHVLFNQPVYEITEKLHMCHSNGQPEDDDNLLYSEKTINGFSTIRRNTGIDGGLLDLELLFKAAIESPDILNAIFDGEGESR